MLSPTDPLTHCTLCPRACGVNRHTGTGRCGMGATLRVALAHLHPWEEPCLSGPQPEERMSLADCRSGSGTIFFSGCALGCVSCQNHDISMPDQAGGEGHDLSVDDLAALMLELQHTGAHNVNLVTPSHFTPLVAQGIRQAKTNGLGIPVVWNSSGYESVDTLRTLEGLVDIYLPDLKHMDNAVAARHCAAPDYPKIATHAIWEMHRQVGPLVLDDNGLAQRGLLVRLLALPQNAARTDLALHWIADTLGTNTAVSLMGQFYPAHRAAEFPELSRGVTREEYDSLLSLMDELGLSRGYTQEVGSSAQFTPDFLQSPGT